MYKKGEKSLPDNYRPIALTSVICKVLEKIIFKYMYNFLNKNSLISHYQSGFTPGDGTVHQLVDLVNFIYESFNEKKEVRSVFLDISKAFDRVWIQGLLTKLRSNGIGKKLLGWINLYLTNRKQRVLLDGFYSTWEITRVGVPQGSVLGPLLFLVFINDITENIQSHIKLFADDAMLYLDVEDHTKAAQILNQDLQNIYAWSQKWLVNFNAKKTESLIFKTKTVKQQHPPLFLHNTAIAEVNSHTHLGLTLSSDGKWEKQITNMISKTNYILAALRKLKNSLDRHTLSRICTSYIRSTMEYASIVWNNCTLLQSNRLEQLQLEASRIVTGSVKGTKHKFLYKETGWLPLSRQKTYFFN